MYIVFCARSDLPYILSGDRLAVIDPHERYFDATTHAWNFARHPNVINDLRAHFEPFIGMFGCSLRQLEAGHFSGTIFRFPLRTRASALCDRLYDAERVTRLFDGFQGDAHLLLLFLKSLEHIELYERDAFQATPTLVFETRLANDVIDLVRHRRQQFIERCTRNTWLNEPAFTSYAVVIETLKHEKRTVVKETYKSLVTNYMVGGATSAIFRKLCADPELHNSPWVGAAMPLDDAGVECQGHVFCFLPLPLEQKSLTGLPVHLNGFFALEHNRKHVKWPSVFRASIRDDLMDKRLLWNQCLLREALPRAYARLLLDAIARHKQDPTSISIDAIYTAMPDFSVVDRRWEPILLPLFTELLQHPIIYTQSAGGCWVEAREAVLDTLPDDHVKSVIMSVLDQGQIRVASVPQHVLDAVRRCYHHGFNRVTPALISQTIKQVRTIPVHSFYILNRNCCIFLSTLPS